MDNATSWSRMRASLFIPLYVLVCILCIDGTKVSTQSKSFIDALIKQYLSDRSTGQELLQPKIIYPVVQIRLDNENSTCSVASPVLLWDPLQQLKHIFSELRCPYCELDNGKGILTVTSIWNDGKSKKRNPRKIFGNNSPILLVGRVYRCDLNSDHCISSTHPTILYRLEKYASVLFKLTVKSGYLNSLSDGVCAMVDGGMSFLKIENTLRSTYQGTGRTASSNKGQKIDSPSAKFLEQLYLEEFHKRESDFIDAMKKTTANWISADHTFKSVMNIGYTREVDGKWVTLFNSLFCILNEKGQILKWQFTKSTKSEETETLFHELAERLRGQKTKIGAMYVDNCCTIKQKMRKYFHDPDLKVKLDLFHAINRFLSAIPKRHRMRSMLARQYRNVFRASGDYGKERKLYTPSPEKLLKNLDCFVRKWKGMKYNGHIVLQKKHIRALSNIELHMKEGCLSHIPPGAGTNRNERLHRRLRKIAGRSKISVNLAYAFFTRAFNLVNANIRSHADDKDNMIAPLEEHFGFQKKKANSSSHSHNLNKSILITDNPVEANIAFQAHTTYSIFRNIVNKGLTEINLREFCPSLVKFSPSSKRFSQLYENGDENVIDQRAKNMGYSRHNIAKNGDCFFESLAFQIFHFMSTCSTEILRTLKDRGISPQQSVDEIAISLRRLVVQEWLANSGLYKHLVDENEDFNEEAQMFLQPGHFAANIGDSMPIAAANAIQLPIVIITSVEDWPLTVVTPTIQSISNIPLYLAYTQEGSGHYDALIEILDIQDSQKHEKQTNELSCRCGVNNKNKGQTSTSCTVTRTVDEIKKPYSTRCKCFKAGVQCGVKCKCRNCGNGKETTLNKARTRKSFKSKFSKSSFTNKLQFKAFLKDRIGDCGKERFSLYELIILHCCLSSVVLKGHKASINTITGLYNTCMDLINHKSTTTKLRKRSEKELEGALKKVDKEI